MKRVALLIETSRAYGRELLLGVRRYVTEHGPWSVFAEIRDLDSRTPSWLRDWDGDGILTRTSSQAMADAIAEVNVPTVELRATRLKNELPFVGIDNQAIGRVCAEHLLGRGYRHFAVYELSTEQFFEQRRDSFAKTLRALGFGCLSLCQTSNREKPARWETQQASLVHWLKELPKPIGILACTDQLGFWLLDACARAGLRVPDEVAVLGVENDETLCAMSLPPLSSLRLGGDRVGYEAAKLLDRMMRGRKPPKKPLLLPPLGIEARQSTDAVAVADELLSQAVRMIREKSCDGLRVDDLLKAIPLSRSSLERGFRSLYGRSPNAEINRVRLQRASELLSMTDLTLDAIAMRTGFGDKHYFSKCFRDAYDMPPGQYRRVARGTNQESSSK